MPFFLTLVPNQLSGADFCNKFNGLSEEQRIQISHYEPPFTINGTKVVGDYECVPPDASFGKAVLAPRNQLHVEAFHAVIDGEYKKGQPNPH